jgi:Cu+-exporting ATPase
MNSPSVDPRRPAQEVALRVTGLNCTNCALSLERHLARVGADSPSVDFASGRTTFSLGDVERLPDIKKSIQRLGYRVFEISEQPVHSRKTALYVKAAVSAALTAPMLIGMFLHIPALHDPWIQLILATPVFLIGILHFGASGLRSLRAGVANMDVLIASGILAGYTASILTLVLGLGHELLFFEAVASITTFILVGHLLEERAVQKTTSAIKDLSNLQPSHAKRIVLDDNGRERLDTILANDIKVGDLLQVNTGDKIPADGTIERGACSLDESMLTGESVPVDRGAGAHVIGGTLLVAGSVVVRTTAVGDDTELAAIVRMVRDAQQRKPSIQRVGDAVSAWFVPAVLLVSALALLVSFVFFDIPLSQAIVRSLAIVVVACPCAMGLATPTAIMVALGRAAKNGILIRGGDTLERLASITHVAFDKTGTLTKGSLHVGELTLHNQHDTQMAKGILVSLQRASSHPIARAITSAYQGNHSSDVALHSIVETKGVGIEGIGEDGSRYVCGGRAVAARFKIETDDDVVLVKGGSLIASLRLQDELRPEAPQVVSALERSGLSTSIISGDTATKCAEIAKRVGIREVHAEQLPEQKLEILRRTQAKMPLVYVGDGINDAPALAEAAVGVSLGSASDVAMKSAQVLLTGGTISTLPKTIQLGRLTVRTIKQNLFWALFYNVAAIPLAALGYISPLAAALLMTFSDIVIVGNSLRIRYRSLESRS